MNKLKHMPVRKRLTISFVIVTILTSIAGLLGAVLLLITDTQYGQALRLNGFIQGDIGHYSAYVSRSGAYARDIVTLTDAAEITKAKTSLAEADEKVAYYLNEIDLKLESAAEEAILDAMQKDYAEYVKLRDQAIAKGGAEAVEAYHTNAMPVLERVMKDADDLMAMNVDMGNKVSTRLSITTLVMLIIIVVVIIAGVIGAMSFATKTAKDFERPIQKVREATEKLASGDLSVQVQVNSQNEFGDMADHFNMAIDRIRLYIETIEFGLDEVGKGNFAVQPPIEFHGDFVALKNAIVHITTTLSNTMRQINDGAEMVAMGAEQLAQNAQTLAEGATSQAGAVQELTATIENVANSASANAETANEAFRHAATFTEVARKGSEEMELLTQAMERITETSKEIESIIADIEDIASQTNLLSLNASIEAARAGEAGRGFAVVADQIGKLAADSAKSAVNTRELIAKSLEEIVYGNEITQKTAEVLNQVVDGIQMLAEGSKQSSELSTEQAETTFQVQQGIEQIAEVVQNNSASAEETSATSEELSAQSQNLKSLVDQFILLEE